MEFRYKILHLFFLLHSNEFMDSSLSMSSRGTKLYVWKMETITIFHLLTCLLLACTCLTMNVFKIRFMKNDHDKENASNIVFIKKDKIYHSIFRMPHFSVLNSLWRTKKKMAFFMRNEEIVEEKIEPKMNLI